MACKHGVFVSAPQPLEPHAALLQLSGESLPSHPIYSVGKGRIDPGSGLPQTQVISKKEGGKNSGGCWATFDIR